MFPPKPLDNFSPEGACSEGLDAFRFFINSTMSGRRPLLYCTLTYITLIAICRDTRQKAKTKQKQCGTSNMVVIIYRYIIGWKDNKTDGTVVHS